MDTDYMTIHEVRKTLDSNYLKIEEIYAHIISNSNLIDMYDVRELKNLRDSLRKVCTSRWTTNIL